MFNEIQNNKSAHSKTIYSLTAKSSLFTVYLQLGPWLAVEVPDLVEKGLISHKEKGKTES